MSQIFIISAPSGAGKTTVVSEIMARDPSIDRPITHTTRQPRPGEQDGVDYHFVTPGQFLELKDEGRLLESAFVHGNCYGTSVAAVDAVIKSGKKVLLIVDWQGAMAIKKQIHDAVLIFMMPPSIAELERRLRARGQDAEEIIAKRLGEAANEMAKASQFDHVVVNDILESAITAISRITSPPERSCKLR